MSAVIHCNPGLKNQRDFAQALKHGFDRVGIPSEIATDRRPKSSHNEITVVQGPHWVYPRFIGCDNVLFLDRTFYGCPKTTVSLGWLNYDGSRDFRNCDNPAKGELPELLPMKAKKRAAVVFGDFGRDPSADIAYAEKKYDAVFYRPHPHDQRKVPGLNLRGDLANVFEIGDVAVGRSSTVLVDAAIHGLHIDCKDPHNVVNGCEDRENWLRKLSWKQWSLDEIRAGDFWEHLC